MIWWNTRLYIHRFERVRNSRHVLVSRGIRFSWNEGTGLGGEERQREWVLITVDSVCSRCLNLVYCPSYAPRFQRDRRDNQVKFEDKEALRKNDSHRVSEVKICRVYTDISTWGQEVNREDSGDDVESSKRRWRKNVEECCINDPRLGLGVGLAWQCLLWRIVLFCPCLPTSFMEAWVIGFDPHSGFLLRLQSPSISLSSHEKVNLRYNLRYTKEWIRQKIHNNWKLQLSSRYMRRISSSVRLLKHGKCV